MGVKKINGNWSIDIRINGKRVRKKAKQNTRNSAKDYEAEILTKIKQGIDPFSKEIPKENSCLPTFREFVWRWFEAYVKPNNKPSEIIGKKITLQVHLIPFFGKTRIDEITNLQIEEYKATKTKTKIVNKTINNHLATLSKCLNDAKDWYELDKIPKIKKLKVPPYKFDYLTQEEAELLLRHSSGIWYEIFLVLLKTGMRKGELLALAWENINWSTRQIIISQSMYGEVITSTKSNRIRYIDMTNEVYNCLYARKKDKGFVFTDEHDKHFLRKRLNSQLEQICRKAGLRRITVHTLRHTFASHLAIAGAPMQAIQGLLGHSDIRTTMRYAHLSPSAYREAIRLLEPKVDRCGLLLDTKADLSKEFEKVLR